MLRSECQSLRSEAKKAHLIPTKYFLSFPIGRFIASDYSNTVIHASAVCAEEQSWPVNSDTLHVCVCMCASISRSCLSAWLLDTSPEATAHPGWECSEAVFLGSLCYSFQRRWRELCSLIAFHGHGLILLPTTWPYVPSLLLPLLTKNVQFMSSHRKFPVSYKIWREGTYTWSYGNFA